MQLDLAVDKYLKSLNDGKSGDFLEFIGRESDSLK